MRGLALALLLMACASASGEGITTDWASNSWTDAADLGNGRWLIGCTGGGSGCARRAAAVCPRGFQVIATGAQLNAAIAQYDGGFGSGSGHSLTVQCS